MPKQRALTPARAARAVERANFSFDTVSDPRSNRGKRYSLRGMLNGLTAATAAVMGALRRGEEFLADLAPETLRAMGLKDAPSDTAMYELVAALEPEGFREVVHAAIRRDLKDKVITNDLIPGGMISIDGKGQGSGLGMAPNEECRESVCDDQNTRCWDAFALRVVLTSSTVRPCLDQESIGSKEAEATTYPVILRRTVEAFPRLFEYVFTDAGMSSASNAQTTLDLGKTYIFQIKDNFGRLLPLAVGLLDPAPVIAETLEGSDGHWFKRELRRVKVPRDVTFPGAQQFWGVRQTQWDLLGRLVGIDDRIFITAADWDALSPQRILGMVRLHWGIENNANWTMDMVFGEDTSCPVKKGYGVQVMSWVRVLAYNLVAGMRAHLPKKDRLLQTWARTRRLFEHAILGVARIRPASTLRDEPTLATAS